jgi:hypothetical protein
MSLAGIMNVLAQYAGGNSSAGANAEQDFDKVSQNATPSHLAQGLSQAFQSNQTPPFAEMVKNLFLQSNGQQRAGLINQLLGSSPGGLSGLLSGGLSGLLQGGGGGNQVTAEQAQNMSPEDVQALAEQAHRNNPSIVDQVSHFYSQHPDLVKTLGAGALTLVMAHMYDNRERS